MSSTHDRKRGGSKKRVSDVLIADAYLRRHEGNESVSALARELKITTQALYQRWAKLKDIK